MGVIDLVARSAIDDVKSAKSTFSSWDKCMQKSYCKWPVIIGIVIGVLIVGSILFCLARCLCCGLECCCGCCSCFNRCCPSGRHSRRSKRADEGSRFKPNPYHGYQPTPHAPPAYEAPKFAQFETSSKNGKPNEDSLPAMPSWDNATTKKVEDASPQENMEMNDLSRRSGQGLMAAAASGPGGRGRYSQIGSNTSSPYGERPSPYAPPHQMHPYGGDISAQQARPEYDSSRPSPSPQASYGSGRQGPYSPQHTIPTSTQPPQASYGLGQPGPYTSQHTSPTSTQPPPGGFRNPGSADQLQPTAMAPTPNQYNHGYEPQRQQHAPYSNYSTPSSTRYEPSQQWGQDSGVTQRSPTSGPGSRPPSILQAGRKPVAGSWRDI